MSGTDDDILEYINTIIATAMSKGNQCHYELIPILSNTSQLMPGIQPQDSSHSSFHI